MIPTTKKVTGILISALFTVASLNHYASAFSTPVTTRPRSIATANDDDPSLLRMTRNDDNNSNGSSMSMSRRAVIASSIVGCLLPVLLYSSQEATAASTNRRDRVVVVTPSVVSEAFSVIRKELESPQGGVAYLQEKIGQRDYPAILEFTKNYDLEFRKAKMTKARKLLTNKSMNEKAILLCNAVTFDLIGINKASRKGNENTDLAMKYLEELKTDLKNFIQLEDTIEFPNVDTAS